MVLSINMLAPSLTPNMNFVAKSGNSYTSDQYGFVSAVKGTDIVDLIGDNCIPVGASGGRSNLAATTAPGPTNDTTQDYAPGSRWLNTTTGLEYVCSLATANAAVWGLQGGGAPAWLTGQFYGIPGGSTQAAVLTVLGTIYAYPIYVPNKCTLSSINVGVTTGQTGGKARGALFYDNGAGYPGAIVAGTDTGDLAATGTAVVTKGSLAIVLNPGLYWFGSIYTASSTMPSVTGATAIYGCEFAKLLGFDTAAHALAVSGQAPTGIAKTGQTYPATDMPTSFPTFPAAAALTLNATTPICSLGV